MRTQIARLVAAAAVPVAVLAGACSKNDIQVDTPGVLGTLAPNTAQGEIRTTGALTGTWHWHESLSACNGPGSLTVSKDGDPASVISVSVGPEDQAGIAGTVVPSGGVSGRGGKFDASPDGQTYTLIFSFVTMTDGTATVVVDGWLRHRCS